MNRHIKLAFPWRLFNLHNYFRGEISWVLITIEFGGFDGKYLDGCSIVIDNEDKGRKHGRSSVIVGISCGGPPKTQSREV
jgi:hypothetical protein